jgi:NAD(P)H-dependent FMN reductase
VRAATGYVALTISFLFALLRDIDDFVKLHVIIASTRPNRIGLPISTWFVEHARVHGKFEVTVVDLKEINLPPMDEPEHPRLQKYTHAHTKAFSAVIAAADAFVLVTPEYNYSTAPALLNAFDHLFKEWNYKPVGFVTYGGISAGTRAAQMTKLTVQGLKAVPIVESVNIAFPAKQLADGKFQPNPANDQAATQMLDELVRWTGALAVLRS